MKTWTETDVRALGVTTDLVTAGSVLGIGRNAAYALNTEGRFPAPVLALGATYRVPVAGLLRLLGLEPPAGDVPPPTPVLHGLPRRSAS